ncbi:PLAT domain-containing protein 3-like [Nicotiana tabacum]|uniref:Lipoxygenase homology domain-containing protein 1-like n=1 Tax=Nicotiana tabacum TaxID=4097 RepID=A0A1S3Z4G5_TOBAC|nr:PREDICTED: lipoxygenase homology domain-containing protein 1-like [Nicotiana tabacum]
MGVAAHFNHFWFLLFILFFSFCISSIFGSDDDCVYTAYVRTSSIIKGGTDSIISLTLYDANGYGIRIKNLEAWGGLMGPGYNYFERGNLDIFSGRAPCLTGPVCKMNLTSDGTGPGHGWYCNYVEVTVTGVHKQCNQQNFEVEQWLATDASPYQLTAIRDNCKKTKSDEKLSISGENLPVSDTESIPHVSVI